MRKIILYVLSLENVANLFRVLLFGTPGMSFRSIHNLLIAVYYRRCGRSLLAKLDTVIKSLSVTTPI